MCGGGKYWAERPSQVPVYDEGDADVSFLTAHSNIHDITHLSHSPVGKNVEDARGKKETAHDEG
jgi:hypothetical protein